MNVLERLREAFALSTLCFLCVALGIWLLGREQATSLYLYELLGVFLTLMITTGGLHGMREIT